MKVQLRKIFLGNESKFNIIFDKSGKERPAWIEVKKMPENIQFIYVRINDGTPAYYVCWYPRINLFMPLDPTPLEMRKYYNRFAKVYDSFVKTGNITEATALLKKVTSLLPKNAKVLDLGAGTGQSTIPFAKRGYKVTLFEISEEMLNIAKHRKELKKCKFIRDDVRNLKLKDRFDLMVSVNSFGCLAPYFKEKEMPGLYKKVANQLKPKGLLALSGYDYEPPKNLFRKIESGLVTLTKGKGTYKHKYYIGRKA